MRLLHKDRLKISLKVSLKVFEIALSPLGHDAALNSELMWDFPVNRLEVAHGVSGEPKDVAPIGIILEG